MDLARRYLFVNFDAPSIWFLIKWPGMDFCISFEKVLAAYHCHLWLYASQFCQRNDRAHCFDVLKCRNLSTSVPYGVLLSQHDEQRPTLTSLPANGSNWRLRCSPRPPRWNEKTLFVWSSRDSIRILLHVDLLLLLLDIVAVSGSLCRPYQWFVLRLR